MNNTIGILLAGGYGTRLYPLTKYQNKHLINLYNKPMIYYSLSTLLLMGIKEIIIVSTKEAIIEFKKIFSLSTSWCIHLSCFSSGRP